MKTIAGFGETMPNQTEHLNINETNALLNAIDDLRDRAIIVLFLNTGVFLKELVDLKNTSINWKTKILAISGNRQRQIPLNDFAFEALARWSKERPDVRCPNFFITTKGKVKQLSDRAVDKLIRKYADQAGIKRKVNAQILRNTFAVRLFSQEISLDKARAILGITDPQSINRYLQASKNPTKPADLSTEALAKVDTRSKIERMISYTFMRPKPKQARAITHIKGPIIPNPEEVIFGRDHAVAEIKASISKKQPVLLMGPLGVGKTHLLKHICRITGPNAIYISSPSPTKNMLSLICDKLNPDWKKQLKTRSSSKDILDYIKRNRDSLPRAESRGLSQVPLLIIDNLNNLKISDVDILITLLENFAIIASTETLLPRLKQIWWKFKQIELKPLSKEATKELIKYLTQNLSISDYELLETRIISFSNDLPLAVVDMVHQISHKPVVNRDAIREVYHEAGITYRDWTFAIIVLWGIAIMFRFVALGTHSFEGYILAGFGMAFLAVMRFFILRMR